MADKKKYFDFTDKIDYVAVEVISKETCEKSVTAIKADDVIYGLFQGFREKVKESGIVASLIYLDMNDKNRSMMGYNPKSHNVVYIEVGHGQYREEIFFQSTPTDQQNALGILRELVEILREEGLVKSGTSYVDTTKYTELPKKIAGKTNTSSASANTSSYSPMTDPSYNDLCGYGMAGYNNNYNNSNYLTAAEKKKRTKPTLFKRSSSLPTEEALTLMKDKILQIQAGVYVQPKFKKTEIEEIDDTDDDDVAEATIWQDEDEFSSNFCS